MTFRATLANRPMLSGVFALILGFVLFVLLFVIRIGVGGGPVSGRVIDVDTNLPIAGAIVVARWQKSSFSIADSTSYCIHVETATSGEDGRYHITRWWQFPPILGFDGLTGMDAYHAGYESAAPPARGQGHPEDVYMKRFAGTSADRFAFLARHVFSGMSCLEGGSSRKNLYKLLRVALAEASDLNIGQPKDTGIANMRSIAAEEWLAGVGRQSPADRDPVDDLPAQIRKELP